MSLDSVSSIFKPRPLSCQMSSVGYFTGELGRSDRETIYNNGIAIGLGGHVESKGGGAKGVDRYAVAGV